MIFFLKRLCLKVLPILISAFITAAILLTISTMPKNPKIPDTPAQRFVADMKVGWNLGNSLDVYSQNVTGLPLETAWGNPKTTYEMIEAVKNAGFNTVRVPITWYGHMQNEPPYKVDDAWMNRVNEVVDYIIDNGMYAIINIHHDDQDWLIPDKEHEQAVSERFRALWLQISEHFKNYNYHLLFESMNEPRVVGSTDEWNGGTSAERNQVDKLNALFVKTVRSTGGNNPERYLMIPTYAASSLWIAVKDFKIPKDKKIIVSIHAYYPYDFTANTAAGQTAWGSDDEKYDLEQMMSIVYHTFVKKGIPVYFSEFGAIDKRNAENRIEWTEFYIKTAKKYGIRCNWWDNGIFNLDNQPFGLIDRTSLTWVYPEIVDAIMRGINS